MSGAPPVSYRSPVDDNARWLDLSLREGDIVISTRSKSGTTWMQMICALLVFQTSDLPAPLAQLSPWLDWRAVPCDEVFAQLAAQEHRRFIKSHTPLDGLPIDPLATYIVVARRPLDMAVSLYHQGDNLDRDRIYQLIGEPRPPDPSSPRPPLLEWIDWEGSPQQRLDSLRGVLWHLSDAWARRAAPNIVLVHYDDLLADLEGEMRRLAVRLAVDVAEPRWPELVRAARFDDMRARPDAFVPDPSDVLKDRTQFFRRGTSGAGRELVTSEEYAHYRARATKLAPPDLLSWLHRDENAGRSAPAMIDP